MRHVSFCSVKVKLNELKVICGIKEFRHEIPSYVFHNNLMAMLSPNIHIFFLILISDVINLRKCVFVRHTSKASTTKIQYISSSTYVDTIKHW